MIKHAYENSEYYKVSFDKAGVTPEDINKVEDLKKIPILNKQDIRENIDKICAHNKCKILHYEW